MDTVVRSGRPRKIRVDVELPKEISPGSMQDVRESLGMTRLEFSRVFGLSEDQIYRWEKGVSRPSGADRRLFGLIRRHGLDYVLD